MLSEVHQRVVTALGEALRAGGVPVWRASVGTLLVHPLLDATLVVWRPDRGVQVIDTP